MHLPRHHRQRRLALVLCSLAATAGLMVPAAAARAHDVLESTSPANGSTVDTVPAKIELTFDHTPIATGSKIQVKDNTGTNQADGPVVIVDNHVTQPLRTGAPAGKYTVIWRVVSADAHPIEGTFTFAAPVAAEGDTDSPAAGGSSAPAAAAPAATASVDRPFTGIPAGVILGGALTAVLVLLLAFFAKRGLGRTDPES